jgi:hypothetical protein
LESVIFYKMKILIPVLLLLYCIACNTKGAKPISGRTAPVKNAAATINYDSCKKQISLLKQHNQAAWSSLPKQKKEQLFTHAVTQTIIPAWIGTPWDFNGTSETPGQGSIACGYFVTTILRDAGLPLTRVRLAQCASEQMMQALIQAKYITHFSNSSMQGFINTVTAQGYGIYIVGLDNHTGFIYNDGTDIYFIHSTFVGTRNVQKEKAAESKVLQQSKYKVLGKLSGDEKVLEKWMSN